MESLNLTPAESLMIVSSKSDGKEMIKLTLMDLLLRRVIKADTRERISRYLKRSYDVTVISKGRSFNIDLKLHEELLIEIIFEYGEMELKEFAKILFKKISSSEYKNKYIQDPLVEHGYFKKERKILLSLIPYQGHVLTDKGVDVKTKILNIVNDGENLEDWIKEDLNRAKAYLSVCGSHILLLNHDLETFKKLNRILSHVKPESQISDYYDYYLCTIPSYPMKSSLDNSNKINNENEFDFLDLDVLDDFDSFNGFFSDFDTVANTNVGDSGE